MSFDDVNNEHAGEIYKWISKLASVPLYNEPLLMNQVALIETDDYFMFLHIESCNSMSESINWYICAVLYKGEKLYCELSNYEIENQESAHVMRLT